jgi:hypothetical protein
MRLGSFLFLSALPYSMSPTDTCISLPRLSLSSKLPHLGHAELEVDNLMATIWAGYKEPDESYVSISLPNVFPVSI